MEGIGEIPIAPVLAALGCANPPEPGKWRPINCVNPDHDDSNASAGSNGYGYKCHACGLKGDAVKIVMEVKKCDRSSALGFVEGVSGGSLPEVSGSTTGNRGRGIPPGRKGTNSRNNRKVSPRVRKRPFAGP